MKSLRILAVLTLILVGCGVKNPTRTQLSPNKDYYPGMVSINPVIEAVGDFKVITVGGGPVPGSVDGIGMNARFNRPEGVALAPDGSLYVADTGNYLIRKVDPSGQVTTVAGSTLGSEDGKGSAARFMGPTDLAFEPNGDLLVADFNRIRRVSPDGTVTTVALKDSLGNPVKYVEVFGVLYPGDGQIYVSTIHRIDRIAQDGRVTTLAGGMQAGYADGKGIAAYFNLPRKMALLGDKIVVADFGNLRLREVTMQGVVTTRTIAGTGDLGYVDGPAGSALMNFPIGVAADQNGILYVADTYNQAIRQVSPDGKIETLAGNNTYGYQDGSGIQANFAQPSDVEVSRDGTWVYVADTGNNAIRLIKKER